MLRRRNGFTVIELLTVIAIIGVLAAFLFPVIASSKDNAKKTQCISNMHQIWTGLKAFQQNEGRYPDFIAGPGTDMMDMKEVSGVTPDRGACSIYPEYVKAVQVLVCPLSIKNGSGREFMQNRTVADPMFSNVSGFRGEGIGGNAFQVYPFSSYDVQIPKNVPGTQIEGHYSPVWQDPPNGMTPQQFSKTPQGRDFVRQLRWKVPPEDTVVTWCSYHREIRNRVLQPGSMDLVLFLDGHVKPISTMQLYGGNSNTTDWWLVWKNARS